MIIGTFAGTGKSSQYPTPSAAVQSHRHISRQQLRASRNGSGAVPLSSPQACPTPPPSRDSGYSSPGELAADAEKLQLKPVYGTSASLSQGSRSPPAVGRQMSSANKKSSFPVALVAALASLPFDQRKASRIGSGRGQQDATSNDCTPSNTSLKVPAAEPPGDQPTTAPSPDPHSTPRPVQQQEEPPPLPGAALQPDDVAGLSGMAAAAAEVLAAAAAEEEAAAAGGSAAAPLDSWGSSFMSSDDESEQLAKQRVIELLSHPAETEMLLLAEAEAQQRQQGSAGSSGGVSVSPEYIDAWVHAVQDPSAGEWHK